MDPAALAIGNNDLIATRISLITNAIKGDSFKKSSKNLVNESDNLTSFKPFSISELIPNKVNIVSKIDEIYNGNYKSKF